MNQAQQEYGGNFGPNGVPMVNIVKNNYNVGKPYNNKPQQ